jgi:hypothetical protein
MTTSSVNLTSLVETIRADASAEKRWRAVFQLLPFANEPSAQDALFFALNDPDWQVRQHAAWVIGEVRIEIGIQHLIQALLSQREDDGQVRYCVALALARLNTDSAMTALQTASQNTHADISRAARAAIHAVAYMMH